MKTIFKRLVVVGFILYSVAVDAQYWTSYTKADGLLSDTVTAVAVDSTNNVWIGTEGFITKMNGDTFTSFEITYESWNNEYGEEIEDIEVSRNGGVWIGTRSGNVYLYEDETLTKFDTLRNYDSYNNVNSISSGVSNDVWFGTESGVWKLGADDNWSFYDTLVSIDDIAVDNNLRLYAVSREIGFGIFHENNWTIYDTVIVENYGTINTFRAYSVVLDDDNNVWLGSQLGPIIYDGSVFNIIENIAAAPEVIDQNGNVWCSTFSNGVYKYNGVSYEHYTIEDGLVNDTINDITIDADGNIWIATNGGISVYSETSSVNDIVDGSNILVYPNPVKKEVFVYTSLPIIKGLFTLYDINGNIRMSKYIYDSETIDVSTLEGGLYFYSIFANDNNYTGKLIKE
jgi:streptogramin lyase